VCRLGIIYVCAVLVPVNVCAVLALVVFSRGGWNICGFGFSVWCCGPVFGWLGMLLPVASSVLMAVAAPAMPATMTATVATAMTAPMSAPSTAVTTAETTAETTAVTATETTAETTAMTTTMTTTETAKQRAKPASKPAQNAAMPAAATAAMPAATAKYEIDHHCADQQCRLPVFKNPLHITSLAYENRADSPARHGIVTPV